LSGPLVRADRLPNPLDLAPGGVYQATAVTCGAGGLLHHRFTLTPIARGGLFSVALSRGSPRVGVTHHLALWSPDFPRRSFLHRDHPANSSTPRVRHRVMKRSGAEEFLCPTCVQQGQDDDAPCNLHDAAARIAAEQGEDAGDQADDREDCHDQARAVISVEDALGDEQVDDADNNGQHEDQHTPTEGFAAKEAEDAGDDAEDAGDDDQDADDGDADWTLAHVNSFISRGSNETKPGSLAGQSAHSPRRMRVITDQ
jgi:hypothetical protein